MVGEAAAGACRIDRAGEAGRWAKVMHNKNPRGADDGAIKLFMFRKNVSAPPRWRSRNGVEMGCNAECGAQGGCHAHSGHGALFDAPHVLRLDLPHPHVLGVTSTSSSGAIYSMQSSRESSFGEARGTLISALDRTLVAFLALAAFTTRSPKRWWIPMTWPL